MQIENCDDQFYLLGRVDAAKLGGENDDCKAARETCGKDTRTHHRSSSASNTHLVKTEGLVSKVQMACRETLSQVADTWVTMTSNWPPVGWLARIVIARLKNASIITGPLVRRICIELL